MCPLLRNKFAVLLAAERQNLRRDFFPPFLLVQLSVRERQIGMHKGFREAGIAE